MAEHMTAEQMSETLRKIAGWLHAQVNVTADECGDMPATQADLELGEAAMAIESIAARLSGMAAVPADHVVVPREPTEEMIAAGCRQWDSTPADQHQIDCCRDTYRAMLAAAQEPPHV